jgi:hypothetical protein
MGPPWRGLPASEIRIGTLPSSPLESLSSVSGDVVVGGAAEPLVTIWQRLVAKALVARGAAKDISRCRAPTRSRSMVGDVTVAASSAW